MRFWALFWGCRAVGCALNRTPHSSSPFLVPTFCGNITQKEPGREAEELRLTNGTYTSYGPNFHCCIDGKSLRKLNYHNNFFVYYLFIHLFIHSFLFIHSVIHSFIFIYAFIHSFIHLFIDFGLFIYLFIYFPYLLVCLIICLFINPFNYLNYDYSLIIYGEIR